MSAQCCAICGGNLVVRHPRVLDPDSGEAFRILACAECGLGHTLPRPADIGRYYDGDYHGGRHGFTTTFRSLRRFQLLQAETKHTGALLDVGCGEGTLLEMARERGWRVAGTELGRAAAAARSRGLEIHEDLISAVRTGPFTCVTLWHSLEHLTDPAAALTEVAGALEPGGTLIVAVPDAQGWQARLFGARWFHLDVPRHLYHFGSRSLTLALDRAGFEIGRRGHMELEYDMMGWVQSALNVVVSEPNLLFRKLTGRPGRSGVLSLAASALLGAATGPMAIPATAAGTLAGRGGTLVMVAHRPPG